jgi:purine catabolism regulator
MLTVQNTLELAPLAGVEVLAGAAGLGRVVQRTVVIEVPEVLAQTKEGDLLMTSVDTFLPHHTTFVQMLDTLNDRRVAGLLIKGNLPSQTATNALVEAATRVHLPLLNLRRQTSYSEIIMAFAAELLERQSRMMRRSEGLRQRFLSAMLSGGGLQHIATLLAKEIGGNSVVITDTNHRRLITHCPLHTVCAAHDEGIETRQTFVELGAHLAVTGATLPRTINTLGNDSGGDMGWEATWMRWTVAVDQFSLGYVYLHGCKRPLRHADTTVLQQASTLVALELLKQRTRLDIEQRRGDFVRAFVTGQFQADEATAQATRALGWQLILPVQPLVFGTRGQLPSTLKASDLSNWATELLPDRNSQDIFWPYDDEVILIRSVDRNLSPSAYREQGIEVATRLQEAFSRRLGVDFYAGVGQVAESVRQLSLTYAQAHQALCLSRSLPTGRVMHCNDMGIYQILLRHPNSDDLRHFMLQTLGRLIQHDLQTQHQLVYTLHVYLAHDRNMRTSAQQLDLHYNSMRYRLQRISEILGEGWDEPSNRLNVEISLKILSLYVPAMNDLARLASYFA